MSHPITDIDPVADLLGGGRTVAYQVPLAHALGDAMTALWVSQLWFWVNHWRSRAPSRDRWDGEWLRWTQEEQTEQTGMSRRECETARRRLRNQGILIEVRRDVPARIWMRLDRARLYEILLARARGDSPAMYSGGKRQCGPNDSADDGENVQRTSAESASVERGNEQRTLAESASVYKERGRVSEISSEINKKSTTDQTDTQPGPEPEAAVVLSTIVEEDAENAPASPDPDKVRGILANQFASEPPATCPALAHTSTAPGPRSNFLRDDPLYQALTETYDVAADTARRLLTEPRSDGRDPRDVCERQVEWLPYRNARDPGGYLRCAIEGDWDAPPGAVQAEQRRQEENRRQAEAERRRAEREEADREAAATQARRDALLAEMTRRDLDRLRRLAYQHAIDSAGRGPSPRRTGTRRGIAG